MKRKTMVVGEGLGKTSNNGPLLTIQPDLTRPDRVKPIHSTILAFLPTPYPPPLFLSHRLIRGTEAEVPQPDIRLFFFQNPLGTGKGYDYPRLSYHHISYTALFNFL